MKKVEDKNVLKTISHIYYTVKLTYGEVEAHLHNEEITGPYKRCRNLIEADLYSLNILRQNVCENTFKNDGKRPTTMNRNFLGNLQVIETDMIIPTMKWLEKTYPEKFI